MLNRSDIVFEGNISESKKSTNKVSLIASSLPSFIPTSLDMDAIEVEYSIIEQVLEEDDGEKAVRIFLDKEFKCSLVKIN